MKVISTTVPTHPKTPIVEGGIYESLKTGKVYLLGNMDDNVYNLVEMSTGELSIYTNSSKLEACFKSLKVEYRPNAELHLHGTTKQKEEK